MLFCTAQSDLEDKVKEQKFPKWRTGNKYLAIVPNDQMDLKTNKRL